MIPGRPGQLLRLQPSDHRAIGAGDTPTGGCQPRRRHCIAAVTRGPGPGTLAPACGPELDSKSHLPLTQALARATVSGPVPVTVTVLPGTGVAAWHWETQGPGPGRAGVTVTPGRRAAGSTSIFSANSKVTRCLQAVTFPTGQADLARDCRVRPVTVTGCPAAGGPETLRLRGPDS